LISYRFGRDDLLRTRFAVSPLFELAASLRALRDPGGHSVHLPWAREARARLAGLDYSLLDALHPSGPYAPDFVAPPPQTPLPVFEEELARVRATPPERVRLEVGWTFVGREVPALARPLLDDPASALPGLVDLMAEYWARALAPFWDLIRAVLEADIRQRARHLAGGGALELFAGLHPDVRWHDGALLVDRRHEATVELAGRGLQLVPAVFGWPEVGAMFDPPWQPALIYPPRGVGDLWAPVQEDPEALADLVGRRRARILAALAAEATTSELARRLAASPAGVSEHLGVLRRAGLVRARREGRAVLYSRTAIGDVLTAPASFPGSPS
jgi:DNA-binding transcriptional ArsR family regulator